VGYEFVPDALSGALPGAAAVPEAPSLAGPITAPPDPAVPIALDRLDLTAAPVH
jgi:hypothetical protein